MTEFFSTNGSLRASLVYEPQPLKFGTSGRRGLVADLTQLEIYINVLAELEYLQSLPLQDGGIVVGEPFYFANDLRPSSTEFVFEEKGRGEIAQAVGCAIAAAGMDPVYLGKIPTPALANYALLRHKGSIMVTGSHIPFDRNGYKTNSSRGELLKKDEAPVQGRVEAVRARLYAQPLAKSIFNSYGMLKSGHLPLPPVLNIAAEEYLQRYTTFFHGAGLHGKRILVYQHSAVGRDLLTELLRRLGAEVVSAGRSQSFVPIDTENIGETELVRIQSLLTDAEKNRGNVDAVVSTDGDSDRPLVLGVENGKVRFFGGDLVGMIVAEYLGADAVVVPISCNDAVDRGPLAAALEPKRKIGSPFVIAGMEQAIARGRNAVCGWEANGGFLTGSAFVRNESRLSPLPTRDAFLPILSVLFAAVEKGITVCELFDRLPRRFSQAALLKNFPRASSLAILKWISPSDPSSVELLTGSGAEIDAIIQRLKGFFTPELGFGDIRKINYTDGVRIYFSNGDIAHIRPSGNADELRIYAVADTAARAREIAAMAVGDNGILRKLHAAAA